MPTTNSRTQILTRVSSNVTIQVTYNAVFSPLERHLAANGLIFRERIRVIGEDLNPATNQILHTFPLQDIPVSAGATPLTVPRNRSITVTRASLQEDPGFINGDDEIRCSIEITPIGLPTVITNSTPGGTLPG